MSTRTHEHTHEKESQAARLLVPDGFSPEDVKNLSSVLNALVADALDRKSVV